MNVNRRQFIKKAGLAAIGTVLAPYILPSGRLFAQTATPLAQHVVLVMFAGGVRHQEAIGRRYLYDSQYLINPIEENASEGNIMPNMLTGEAPTIKVVYGCDPPAGAGPPGSIPIPPVLQQPLQESSTLFSEMRSGSAGHYNGLVGLVSGNYAASQGLRQKPVNPTIFEYLRRYRGEAAGKVWFVGNGIGNSTPLLNYSRHSDFGPQYGANFFAPGVTFGSKGIEFFADAKNYHPEEDLGPVYEMKSFLDKSFLTTGGLLPDLGNTPEEKYSIKQFMDYIFNGGATGTLSGLGCGMSGDSITVAYACEVLKWFKPTLLAVNMGNVDTCHSNFTNYLRSMHRADFAVGYLWNYIQTQIPDMAGNTIMIVVPECGRNEQPNAIKDFNDWRAYDHSDANATRVFGMMTGPNVPTNLTIGNEANPIGNAGQVALTIAEILGIKQPVADAGMVINGQSLFDLI